MITKADAEYKFGSLAIKQKMTTWTANKMPEVKWIVIHNTNEVKHSNTSMAAQYCQAQFNHNLGDVAVHYYVDEKEVWHCLPDTVHGWHAADGTKAGGGNMCGIAIEVIEDKTNAVAEDRAAYLTALLLDKNKLPISAVKQHHDFYNKNCPVVIRPHWDEFIKAVQKHLDAMRPVEKTETGVVYTVQVGAFSVKANAEAYAEKIKKAGFDCYVTVKGDVDGDGKITVADAQKILQKAVGK